MPPDRAAERLHAHVYDGEELTPKREALRPRHGHVSSKTGDPSCRRCDYCARHELAARRDRLPLEGKCESCSGPLVARERERERESAGRRTRGAAARGAALVGAIHSRWISLFTKVVFAEAGEALPSQGDALDERFEYCPCNGHVNDWAAAVCPCQDFDIETPTWLLGKSRDPHDWSNCSAATHDRTYHDEECCEAEGSAEDDVGRRNRVHWWRWPRRYRRYLRHGVRLPWMDGLPPERFSRGNYDTAQHPKAYKELCRLRAGGYLEGPYFKDDRTHVIVTQPIGAVAKRGTEKVRVIVDFSISKTNDRLPKWLFKLPVVEDVVRHLRRPGMVAAQLDLGDAFLHIPTAPSERGYYCIEDPTPVEWAPDDDDDPDVIAGAYQYASAGGARTWRFKSTPFGCSLSPYFFCTAATHVIDVFKRLGFAVEQFVDDCIIVGDSVAEVNAKVTALRAAWSFLGLNEKLIKYCPPSTQFRYLGLEFDTIKQIVRYPDDKRDALLGAMQEFQAEFATPGCKVPRKRIATLVGKMNFAARGVRHGRIYTRRLYHALHDEASTAHLTLTQRIHGHGSVVLERGFWQDFEWWMTTLPHADGVRYFPDRTLRLQHVWGDASKAGRGATWYGPDGPQSISEAWDESMRQASSNLREITTFEDAVHTFGEGWPRHSRICYTTDNTTTAKALNSGYTRSTQCMEVVRRVHAWASARDITILARWAPGVRLIAEGSDGLSRAENFERPKYTEWQLDEAAAKHWRFLGDTEPELPLYPHLDRVIRDALAAHTRDSNGGARTLLVPDWPTASWYPSLRRFRPWYRYPAGSAILRSPDRPDVLLPTKHPVLVMRLPREGERPLSRNQLRRVRNLEKDNV